MSEIESVSATAPPAVRSISERRRRTGVAIITLIVLLAALAYITNQVEDHHPSIGMVIALVMAFLIALVGLVIVLDHKTHAASSRRKPSR